MKVSGPLVVATGLADANMSDVVRVGPQRLIGEILTMKGDSASIQVYEETSGLGPGAEVIEASGIQLGDNLFLLNKYEAARSIAEQLPYIDIEDIRIRRELPDTLLIDVAECGTPLAVIQDGSAWLLSPKGKIVEQLPASQAGDYAVIDGCELLAPSVGTDIALSTEFANQQTSLLALLAALDAAGLTASFTVVLV